LSDDASIFDIAWRTGGQAILAAAGGAAEAARGSDLLRQSITRFAENGGAAFIDKTMTELFGSSESLSDTQVGQLGSALVDRWRE